MKLVEPDSITYTCLQKEQLFQIFAMSLHYFDSQFKSFSVTTDIFSLLLY